MPQTIAAASFAPDRAGGVFAAWTRYATGSPPTGGSLWATHVTSSGHAQPPRTLATGTAIIHAGLIAAARDRALAIWNISGHGIYGADLGPGPTSALANHAAERQTVTPSLAVDAAGTALVGWAHTIKRPTMADTLGVQQVRYATIPSGAHAFCS